MSSTGSKCCEKCISIKYPRGDAEYVCTVPYCPCHSPLDTYRKAPELLNVDPWARRDKNCKRVPAMKSGYCREEVDYTAEQVKDEIIKGLLVLAAILAIGVFLIAL